METASVRKQNSSCDPCRRSKRRCAFPNDASAPPMTCINCIHLGHACTFDFVNSRLGQKRNKTRPISSGVQQYPIAPALPRCVRQPATPLLPDSASADALTSPIQDPLVGGNEYTDFHGLDMFMGNIVSEWTALDKYSFSTENLFPTEEQPHDTPASITQSSKVIDKARPPHTVPERRSATLGLWRGSPIHLLNSSVETQRINHTLGDVYNSMMDGIAIRYLDYNCNLFAGSYKYSFEFDQAKPSALGRYDVQPGANAFTPPWRSPGAEPPSRPQLHGLSIESLASQINKVTMIGIARFLDNFGPLYGNNIDAKTRGQHESTLTAVLQAFALQHLPSSKAEGPLAQFSQSPDSDTQLSNSQIGSGNRNGTSKQVFVSAWFNAHSQLVESKDSRSFIRLYCVFLFLMTSIPEEATSIESYENTPLGLIDDALSQLEELQGLVENYCDHLARQSIYRFLLDSSLGIMRWYAYLRDTIDSIVHGRSCMLEDVPMRAEGSLFQMPPQWQEPAAFDRDVPENCQKSAGDLFRVFRGVTRLRTLLSTSTTSRRPHAIRDAIALSLDLVEKFTVAYGPWLDQCVLSFYLLSAKSKLASAFMLLFWKMSDLLLVEQLHRAADLLPPAERQPILAKAQSYQRAAVTSLLMTAKRIVDVSASGEFKLINSVQAKMHFISHHANTSIVVLALSKAIEHTIDLHVSVLGDNLSLGTFPEAAIDFDWIASMKPLLICLLTLDSTISGALTARPALQRLMQHYGDILMDCWSHEDV